MVAQPLDKGQLDELYRKLKKHVKRDVRIFQFQDYLVVVYFSAVVGDYYGVNIAPFNDYDSLEVLEEENYFGNDRTLRSPDKNFNFRIARSSRCKELDESRIKYFQSTLEEKHPSHTFEILALHKADRDETTKDRDEADKDKGEADKDKGSSSPIGIILVCWKQETNKKSYRVFSYYDYSEVEDLESALQEYTPVDA